MNWLLLRGLGREVGHWGDFPDRVRQGTAASNVVCIDLPGTGQEHRQPCPAELTEITDFLRQRWLHQQSGQPSYIVGLSLGGMVALDWISRHSNDFAGAVIMNSSLPKLSMPLSRIRPLALARLLRIMTTADTEEREKRVLEMTSNLRRHDHDLVLQWAAIARTRPTTRQTVIRQLRAAMTFNPPAEVRVPGLVLASRQDSMVHVRCSRAIAQRYKWSIVEHSHAGHDLALDDPDWVVERLRDFSQNLADD